jgi:hypothetical protein
MNTPTYKRLVVLLAFLLSTSVLMLAGTQFQLNRTKNDIRSARELVEGFHSYRDLALKSEPVTATYYLQKLRMPSEAEPFQNIAADFVELERKRAVKDIVAYLRNLTGKNFGDEPEKWIQALGVGFPSKSE